MDSQCSIHPAAKEQLLFLWPSPPKTKGSSLLDLLGARDGTGPWYLCFYQLELPAKGGTLHVQAAFRVLKLWPLDMSTKHTSLEKQLLAFY